MIYLTLTDDHGYTSLVVVLLSSFMTYHQILCNATCVTSGRATAYLPGDPLTNFNEVRVVFQSLVRLDSILVVISVCLL